MSEDRAAKLAEIAAEVRVCTACRLHQGTKNAVPGYGDVNAEILFIGEGPGFNEDEQGLPFVGRSGKYLDYLLNLIDLKREQVFITNVVKHRPPENRDPMPDEILACKHFLDRQIALIQPLVIATLGRFSMESYFPGGKITKIHGQPKYADDRAYFPMFHPAYVLRNDTMRQPMEEDVKRLPELIAEVKRRRVGGKPTSSTPPEPEAPPTPSKPQDPPQQLKLF